MEGFIKTEWTSWEKEIHKALHETKENFRNLEFSVPKLELKREFPLDMNGPYGTPFIAWGHHYVYFSVWRDYVESVDYLPKTYFDFETEGKDYKVRHI